MSFELLKLGYRLGAATSLGVWMLWDCVLQVMGVRSSNAVGIYLFGEVVVVAPSNLV